MKGELQREQQWEDARGGRHCVGELLCINNNVVDHVHNVTGRKSMSCREAFAFVRGGVHVRGEYYEALDDCGINTHDEGIQVIEADYKEVNQSRG